MSRNTVFANNLKRYMAKYDKTRKQCAADLGVPYTTFTDWVNGNRMPKMDKVEEIASYFHCRKADLLEESDNLYFIDEEAAELADFLKNNPEYMILFDASRKVKPEDIMKVKALIDLMSNK